jgi:ubiquinone/menaquinone biosynthesis C-methylase UbiE
MQARLLAPLYRTGKLTQAAVSALFMRALHTVMHGGPPPAPSRAEREALAARVRALLDADVADAAGGVYPTRLLFQLHLSGFLKALPEGLLDLPRVVARRRRNGFQDLPPAADDARYPAYYRRTFHWQSDGWFSERSARLYDPGVDLLFGGLTDAMRRRALPPLVAAARDARRPLRVLDVATGTGRFAAQLAAALPSAELTLLDLSEPYLAFAKRRLAAHGTVRAVAANAEAMPLPDASFDAVSCVFLFHEMPKGARRAVMREALRVLRPGGLFAVVDSAQLDDSAELSTFLEAFPATYHEPYYKGYVRDPLPVALSECGFEVVSDTPALVSRVVIARRPIDAQTEGPSDGC